MRAMADVFVQTKIDVAEFLAMWVQGLPDDGRAALDDKLRAGHHLGFHVVTTGPVSAHITLTDPAGITHIANTIVADTARR